MNENLLSGGDGYLPAIYIYGRLAQLALDAKQLRTKLIEKRGPRRLIAAEWHDLSRIEWRINQGDILISNQRIGHDPFTFWVDEREARALIDIQRHEGEALIELAPDRKYWGARVIKIRGSLNQAKRQGTTLHLQRRDTSIG